MPPTIALRPEKILPPDRHQHELTERLILPVLGSLMADFHDLRVALDGAVIAERCAAGNASLPNLRLPAQENSPRFSGEVLAQSARHYASLRPELWNSYPIGCCGCISGAIFGYLRLSASTEPAAPFAALHEFVRQGGTFRRIWGSIRNIYFQSAFQLGTLYVDVANDTVHRDKPRTEQAPLERSGFRNIASLREYAGVRASYHRREFFLNTLFPSVLPYHALIAVNRAAREVEVEPQPYVSYVTVAGDEPDFFPVDFSGEPAPVAHEGIVAALARPFRAGRLCRAIGPEEWRAIVAATAAQTEATRGQAAEVARKVTALINHLWQRDRTYDRIEPWLGPAPEWPAGP